ncbi:MAG: cyclic nucleotide-binding domain-containing protein [Fidelibacterota bacterium]|nr:MAG: cyclic nucleotide-binding domain-containing protein [Candidatus Neomarinimicrobiota bacterium]
MKRQVKKGDIIFRDGNSGQSMFIVLEGQVEISKLLGDQKTVLAKLGVGAIFGEMAIIDNQPRSATATALTNGIVLEISREMFRTRLEEVPKWLQTFFGIIVERLRVATRNQSILLARGAGRQVTNLLAFSARREEPDEQGKIILPWSTLISSIAFLVGLNEEQINETVNKLVSAHLGKSDRREGIGRVFIVEDPDKLYQFADYCRERHMVETDHAKQMSEQFRFKDKSEMELLQAVEEIVREQGAIEDFPAATLEKRLKTKFKGSMKVYQPVIDSFGQSGILESFNPEGSEPAYRVSNRELLEENLAKVRLLAELSDLEQKIMG